MHGRNGYKPKSEEKYNHRREKYEKKRFGGRTYKKGDEQQTHEERQTYEDQKTYEEQKYGRGSYESKSEEEETLREYGGNSDSQNHEEDQGSDERFEEMARRSESNYKSFEARYDKSKQQEEQNTYEPQQTYEDQQTYEEQKFGRGSYESKSEEEETHREYGGNSDWQRHTDDEDQRSDEEMSGRSESNYKSYEARYDKSNDDPPSIEDDFKLRSLELIDGKDDEFRNGGDESTQTSGQYQARRKIEDHGQREDNAINRGQERGRSFERSQVTDDGGRVEFFQNFQSEEVKRYFKEKLMDGGDIEVAFASDGKVKPSGGSICHRGYGGKKISRYLCRNGGSCKAQYIDDYGNGE